MDWVTKAGDVAKVVGAVVGAVAVVAGMVRSSRAWWTERRLRRACDALLARTPAGAGVAFRIAPEDYEAADWGERHGLLGDASSFDGRSVYRK